MDPDQLINFIKDTDLYEEPPKIYFEMPDQCIDNEEISYSEYSWSKEVDISSNEKSKDSGDSNNNYYK